jgi:hypothetical protein
VGQEFLGSPGCQLGPLCSSQLQEGQPWRTNKLPWEWVGPAEPFSPSAWPVHLVVIQMTMVSQSPDGRWKCQLLRPGSDHNFTPYFYLLCWWGPGRPKPHCPTGCLRELVLKPKWKRQEIEKGQKRNMQKAGIRWAGCLGGDTQQPQPPPASLLYTVANKEVEHCSYQEQGNLQSLLSACTGTVAVWRVWHKHPCSYAKQLCCILLSYLLQLGAVPIPACRLFDMAVHMSGSPRLLIVHSPQRGVRKSVANFNPPSPS